jgi:glutamate-1-semialdehyde 2,1-aminomutase
MVVQTIQYIAIPVGSVLILWKSWQRLQLSRAKHPSLRGHAKLSRLMASLVPSYEYDEEEFFNCDNVPVEVAERRKAGFTQLGDRLGRNVTTTLCGTTALEPNISDMQFTNANRVPFQFRRRVSASLKTGALAAATSGVRIQDMDGNWTFDVGGSYGVNLLGYDFYKRCIERGMERARDLGPLLGPYHPVISENVAMIKDISGQDEVSFHMSGTEAVMQAVRLARFHTRRQQLVLFCGAYHGWWDGVQAGVGHRRSICDIYMLRDMSEHTLRVLRARRDIACVLVNPLQALHPNAGAASDAMLLNSERHASFDRQAYAGWLQELRKVCTSKGIVLIFDEVFVGFRLGLGGAQAFFGVKADMVTYGKTIGGGLPVGVLAGRGDLMKRYRQNRPADVCFARGTFNSHPYVMASMNEFLIHVTQPEVRAELETAESRWNGRIRQLNDRLHSRALPVRISNLSSVCVVTYTVVSRYNWMFQYYLRAEGLSLSWVGTARLIFSHDYTDDDFEEVAARFLRAAEAMQGDGWWFRNGSASNRSIRRQVLAEILASRLS